MCGPRGTFMQMETKFARIMTPISLGSRLRDWEVT